MKSIEPIDIVFTSNGNKAKRSYNWLLSRESDWAMDVNPFIIQDFDLKRKVEGLTYNGEPVAEALKRKYPKHGLEVFLRDETEEKEEIRESDPLTFKSESIDLEELSNKGISEIKMTVDENEIDIEQLIEIEKANKNRKTLIDYLNGIK